MAARTIRKDRANPFRLGPSPGKRRELTAFGQRYRRVVIVEGSMRPRCLMFEHTLTVAAGDAVVVLMPSHNLP